MRQDIVVKPSCLPPRLPVVGTLAWVMFLDWVSAPSWLCGAWAAAAVVTWLLVLYRLWTIEFVDIFEGKRK